MNEVVADKGWNREISRDRNKSTHCPYATVDKCPRYYQSLSLLSGTGDTKIDKKEDEKLFRRWKKSDLWPKIVEQATSVRSSGDKFLGASNYCPEVLYERFGVHAKSITSFSDEVDQDAMHNYLRRIKAKKNDARWFWSHVDHLHYTDCSLYSVLENNASNASNIPWWREHLAKLAVGVLLAIVVAIVKLGFA